MSTVIDKPSPLAVWVMAARPRTLPAAIVPVVVGSAIARADGAFSAGPCLAALAGACLIQIGTNFANDYFDFKKGADTDARQGPTRVTQAGLASPKAVLTATAIAFGLAVLVGCYLVAVGGWPIVAIGVLSILSGLAYTGGPYPLGYNGLGEVFVFIFFGLVAVLGTYYVQALHLSSLAWGLAVPVGLIAAAINVVNNLRDIETDRVAGKKTLSARFGARFTHGYYATLLAGAYLVPSALVATGKLGLKGLLPLLTLPLALKLFASVRRDSGPVLNGTLAGTAKLLMIFGLLLSVGLLLP
ncbi:MAG TPA: 1,4-dihydroxy-2-naphthoate polyprenyltransferase [Pantanalinema sp.]